MLHAVDVDRILFAVDHPYDSAKRGRDFLDHLPVSRADRHRIPHRDTEQPLGPAWSGRAAPPGPRDRVSR
ncbi:hypothetical protein [Saccharothrix sp.]|uniref:hypothetical protein n=1 Tax=Saccharothrix sp. TaxID=1873460 RepID=UPI002811C697|nr:hypothetical protein [Saccharothrix sp.]